MTPLKRKLNRKVCYKILRKTHGAVVIILEV